MQGDRQTIICIAQSMSGENEKHNEFGIDCESVLIQVQTPHQISKTTYKTQIKPLQNLKTGSRVLIKPTRIKQLGISFLKLRKVLLLFLFVMICFKTISFSDASYFSFYIEL